MHARKNLAKATATVLANGLGILGIDAPDQM
jgi:arginyl-tRNA synthetase